LHFSQPHFAAGFGKASSFWRNIVLRALESAVIGPLVPAPINMSFWTASKRRVGRSATYCRNTLRVLLFPAWRPVRAPDGRRAENSVERYGQNVAPIRVYYVSGDQADRHDAIDDQWQFDLALVLATNTLIGTRHVRCRSLNNTRITA
jgi:hypothetical protein